MTKIDDDTINYDYLIDDILGDQQDNESYVTKLADAVEEKLVLGINVVEHWSYKAPSQDWNKWLLEYRGSEKPNQHKFVEALDVLVTCQSFAFAKKRNNLDLAEEVRILVLARLIAKANKGNGKILSNYDVTKGASIPTFIYRVVEWSFSDAVKKAIAKRIDEAVVGMHEGLTRKEKHKKFMEEEAEKQRLNIEEEINKIVLQKNITTENAREYVYRRIVSSISWEIGLSDEPDDGEEFTEPLMESQLKLVKEALNNPDVSVVDFSPYGTIVQSPVRIAAMKEVFYKMGNLLPNIGLNLDNNDKNYWMAYWGVNSDGNTYLGLNIGELAIELGESINILNASLKITLDAWLSPPFSNSTNRNINLAREEFGSLAKHSYRLIKPVKEQRKMSESEISQYVASFPKYILKLKETSHVMSALRKVIHDQLQNQNVMLNDLGGSKYFDRN